MKSQMKRADRAGSRFVLVIGENELAKDVVALRDMQESQQEEVPWDNVGDYLKSRLRP